MWRRTLIAALLPVLIGCSSRPATLESAPISTLNPPVAELEAKPPQATNRLPQWVDGGRSLLYIGRNGENGGLTWLDLASANEPRQLTDSQVVDGRLSPDGKTMAYIAPGPDGQRPMTIYLKPADSHPLDALPGDLARRGMTSVKWLHRWLDDKTLAYQEHMGTAANQLFLLDTERLELVETEPLSATSFIWSADGRRVAGQRTGGPPTSGSGTGLQGR